jgi:hypothetical protein
MDAIEAIAYAYVCESSPNSSLDLIHQAYFALLALIRRLTTPAMAMQQCRVSVGTDAPVQRVLAILNQPLEPLPDPGPNVQMAANDRRHKARTWTEIEDQRLIAGIMKYGNENWNQISKFVGSGRSRAQCSQRWNRGLNPQICKATWTDQEEADLVNSVAMLGERSWRRVAAQVGHRSDVQCRYHFRQLQKTKEQQDPVPIAPTTAKKAPKSDITELPDPFDGFPPLRIDDDIGGFEGGFRGLLAVANPHGADWKNGRFF